MTRVNRARPRRSFCRAPGGVYRPVLGLPGIGPKPPRGRVAGWKLGRRSPLERRPAALPLQFRWVSRATFGPGNYPLPDQRVRSGSHRRLRRQYRVHRGRPRSRLVFFRCRWPPACWSPSLVLIECRWRRWAAARQIPHFSCLPLPQFRLRNLWAWHRSTCLQSPVSGLGQPRGR